MKSALRKTPRGNRRLEALIDETMNIFQMDRQEAATTALSMLIRELILAAYATETMALTA